MTSPNRSADAATSNKKHHNRVAAIMIHLPRYYSMGASLLARDAEVSKSTISHLLRGKSHPLYMTALKVVKCLELELGFPLDHREVFSPDGSYPTYSVCELARCPNRFGCLPAHLFDSSGEMKPGLYRRGGGNYTGDNFEFEEISEAEGGA